MVQLCCDCYRERRRSISLLMLTGLEGTVNPGDVRRRSEIALPLRSFGERILIIVCCADGESIWRFLPAGSEGE